MRPSYQLLLHCTVLAVVSVVAASAPLSRRDDGCIPVRSLLVTGARPGYMGLREVELTDGATGLPVTLTGVRNGYGSNSYGPEACVDGRLETVCDASSSPPSLPWFEFTVADGQERCISRAVVWTRTDGQDAGVPYRSDGATVELRDADGSVAATSILGDPMCEGAELRPLVEQGKFVVFPPSNPVSSDSDAPVTRFLPAPPAGSTNCTLISRVRIVSRGNTFLGLRDVAVYDQDGRNVAPMVGSELTRSDYPSVDYGPVFCRDGLLDTICDSSGAPAWLQLSFRDPVCATAVHVYNRIDGADAGVPYRLVDGSISVMDTQGRVVAMKTVGDVVQCTGVVSLDELQPSSSGGGGGGGGSTGGGNATEPRGEEDDDNGGDGSTILIIVFVVALVLMLVSLGAIIYFCKPPSPEQVQREQQMQQQQPNALPAGVHLGDPSCASAHTQPQLPPPPPPAVVAAEAPSCSKTGPTSSPADPAAAVDGVREVSSAPAAAVEVDGVVEGVVVEPGTTMVQPTLPEEDVEAVL